jgi:CRISPR/Cas system CSM-associated protein Csm3 (group 7 of RAMP superfamily)
MKEKKERNKRMSQDMEKLVEKRKKEIEKKEKEDEEKKKQILDKFKEKEKEIERKRIKEKRLIMAKYMPYRKLKLETKEDDYTYAKLKKKYENTENNLFKQVNLEKKKQDKNGNP